MTWIRVCSWDEVSEDGDAAVLDVTPPVAVFNSGGDFYAIDDTCTHADFSLADGFVEDCTVECPVHLAKFCLKTGDALKLPATRPVRTFPVRVDAGAVWVNLADRAPRSPGNC